MTERSRRTFIALAPQLVAYPLDEDIAQATRIDLESATALVNAYLQTHNLVDLDQPGRDEIARLVIQDELEARYLAEKARRSGLVH